ncbi:hypothetical protein GCM10023149_00030 [Mucilaginibacter gynuensis]|uniref:Uncharacterized protein n=1 Tax=Mucilaginibacter gynuensis TaxID=1302236 RepID=A0ABP8FLP1_9SPHI
MATGVLTIGSAATSSALKPGSNFILPSDSPADKTFDVLKSRVSFLGAGGCTTLVTGL